MKRTSIVLSAVLATLITGCTTFHASQPSVDLATKVSGNINADIDVGDKISGDSKVVTLLGFINFGDDKFADGINYGAANFSFGDRAAEEAKSAASYKAVSTAKADLIVMPRYSIEVTNFLLFKTTSVRVIGNKGTIKSFKASDLTTRSIP